MPASTAAADRLQTRVNADANLRAIKCVRHHLGASHIAVWSEVAVALTRKAGPGARAAASLACPGGEAGRWR